MTIAAAIPAAVAARLADEPIAAARDERSNEQEHAETGQHPRRQEDDVVAKNRISREPVHRQAQQRLTDERFGERERVWLREEAVGVPEAGERRRMGERGGQRSHHPSHRPDREKRIAVAAGHARREPRAEGPRHAERQDSERCRDPARGFHGRLARTSSDMPNDGGLRLFALEERHQPLEGRELALGQHRALQHARVQPPAEHAGPVQVADARRTSKPALGHQLACSASRVVAAEVVQGDVERAVERRHRRHEQHQPAARRRAPTAKSRSVGRSSLDVLEHVHAHDRVDAARRCRSARSASLSGKRNDATRTLLAVLEPPAQLAQVVRLDVGGDDPLAVGEVARLVADARADFEDALAEEARRSGRAASCCTAPAVPCGAASSRRRRRPALPSAQKRSSV